MRFNSKKLSRREMLKLLGVGAAGAALAGCAPVAVQPAAPESDSAAETGAGAAAEATGGEMVEEVGPYLAYTDVSGTVDFPNCWGGARIPVMEDQIAGFSELYPNIEVKSSVSDCGDLEKQHLTSIASGAPPNAIMLRADAIPFFVEQGALMPLDDLAARDELDVYDVFYQAEVDTRRWKGQLYGLPAVTGGNRHMLWWNKDLFEEAGLDPDTPPVTWDDLNEMADITRENTENKFFLEFNHTSGAHPPFLVWLTSNGGQYINEDLTEIIFNSEEGLETLEWMLQFAQRQAGSYETMAAIEAPRMNAIEGANWVAGTYLTATAGPWYFLQIASAAPDLEYGVTLLPYNDDEPDATHATPSYAGWAYCIPAGAENIEPAWEWIKYATAGRGQYNFMKAQDRPTVVRAYNADPDFAGGNPWWDVVMADLEANVPIPVMPTWPAIRDVMFDMTESVLFENQTPQEALEGGAAEAQRLLDEWLAG